MSHSRKTSPASFKIDSGNRIGRISGIDIWNGFFVFGSVSDVTRILDRVQLREAKAAEELLLPLVYKELRRLANLKMGPSWRDTPSKPLPSFKNPICTWLTPSKKSGKGSRHFIAAASERIRHILIDAARKKRRLKRGGDWQRIDLEELHLSVNTDPDGLLAINDALEDFAREDPAKAELVKLRFFVGLSLPQAAETLGLSLATAKRFWAFARAWLYRRLNQDG